VDSGLWVWLKQPFVVLRIKFPSKLCSERMLFGDKKVFWLCGRIASFVVDAIFLRSGNLSALLPFQDSGVWVGDK